MTLEDYLHKLKALSSLTRFRILNLLYQKDSLAQWQIVDALEVSKSNISRHAKILLEANLIIDWKDRKQVFYHLNPNLKPKSILLVLKEFQKNETLQRDLRKLKKLTKPITQSRTSS